MIASRLVHELPAIGNPEIFGLAKRPRQALHVKIDGYRVVERRKTELRLLHRQFNDIVTRTSRFQDDSLEAWRSKGYMPALQRWCAHLERDVYAVCSEAGLSPAAAAAVTGAASKGIIPQNPGVLLCRLLRFQECMYEPLGRRDVLGLLRTAPTLLRYSPESLRWNIDMLGTLLPDSEAVASAVRRAPMLLASSAITLWGNFEGLRQLLRLNHDEAIRVVQRAPRLLRNSKGALEGRLEALMLLAGGAPRRAVMDTVARQPSLLGYFPGTLERNLRAAAAVLAVPFSRVQPLLLKQPAFVMLARDTLRDRIMSLRDAAGLYDASDLAAVVLRQPSLLTLSPETVRRKVAVVERVLGLEHRPNELRAVLRGAPQVLTLAADSIELKAAALRAAVAPCAALRSQLQRTPPQAVAVWLCFSAHRYAHVRTVAESEAKLASSGALGAGLAGGAAVVDRLVHKLLPSSEASHAKGACCSSMEGTRGPQEAEQQEQLQLQCSMVPGGGGSQVKVESQGSVGALQTASDLTGAQAKRGRGRPRRQQLSSPHDVEWQHQRRLDQAHMRMKQSGESGMAGIAASVSDVVMEGPEGSRDGNREGELESPLDMGVETRPRLSLYALLRDGGSTNLARGAHAASSVLTASRKSTGKVVGKSGGWGR